MLLKSITLTLLVVIVVKAQGPPGVPPRQNQQFQQPPPPNQQQQQFQQQQQGQQQQFHQPQGQQQQFQQQQQPNVQEGHGHGGGNKLKFSSEIHNAEHIIEHLQDQIKTKPKEQMSEEELEFHYFKMHDYDNNNKLDGVEIGKALTHFHDEHEPTTDPHPPSDTNQDTNTGSQGGSNTGSNEGSSVDGDSSNGDKHVQTDEDIASLVDVVLQSYDKDDDGYVEYFEFKTYKLGDEARG
ncbi:lymphotoxin beta receptor inhibitor-like isoform X2 [Littorina saxatilis]|uniref:lymphotoxin beta receptor inhibitor-like isoform X2 n=1 Tax=Littorina saxatilis TaxID=31220 RepID=UPI0038B69A19